MAQEVSCFGPRMQRVRTRYLFTLAQWLEADGVDLARLPRVADHRRRMSERPGVKRAVAEENG
jgi:hypothetical protein